MNVKRMLAGFLAALMRAVTFVDGPLIKIGEG